MNNCKHPKIKTNLICPDCGWIKLPIVNVLPEECAKCGSQNLNGERGLLCEDCKHWEARYCTPRQLVASHRQILKEFVTDRLEDHPEKAGTASRFGWPDKISDQYLIWLVVLLNDKIYENEDSN